MTGRTIETTLDDLQAWVEAAIAPELEYLVPPDDGRVDDFEAVTGNPTVYQSFVPGKERLHEGDMQAPAIAVQLVSGSNRASSRRTLSVRLMLVIWSPGHFDADGYHRDNDGWRDLYNGLDAMVTAIEEAEVIAGCTVDHNRGIQYGYLDIDGEIPDLYPYWIGRVDFDLLGATPGSKRFNEYL